VSHSSDHFAKCEELARKMIKDGLAYMDDTNQVPTYLGPLFAVLSSLSNLVSIPL